MSKFYTSDDLVKSVIKKINIPLNRQTFTEEDILAFADEELDLGVIPSIRRVHEDFLTFTDIVPLQQNKSRYEIPYRASGNILREVSYSDQSNNVIELTRIPIERLPDYNTASSISTNSKYYILNNEIVLYPEIQNQGTGNLLMTFYMRPSKLVLLKNVGVITSLDRVNKQIVLDKVPLSFTADKLFDFVRAKSPHPILQYDIQVTSIDSVNRQITFTGDLPQALQVGDHFTLACESAIPQIPSDLHSMLSHRVAMACLQANGDLEAYGVANERMKEIEFNVPSLIDNRVEGSPPVVVNRHGFLRQRRRNFGRRF